MLIAIGGTGGHVFPGLNLAKHLLKNKLVDEIHLFKSKIIIGENGKPAIIGKKFKNLKY